MNEVLLFTGATMCSPGSITRIACRTITVPIPHDGATVPKLPPSVNQPDESFKLSPDMAIPRTTGGNSLAEIFTTLSGFVSAKLAWILNL